SLGAATSLAAVSLLHPLIGQGSWWRLTLDHPLREPLLLETTFDIVGERLASAPAGGVSTFAATNPLESLALVAVASEARFGSSDGRRWEVPLFTVFSA